MKKYRMTCQGGGVNTGLVAGVALGLAAALFLTHDILITNFLAFRLCRADPEPKTFVRKTVEFPGSIYWEDTIYPGFDEKDRLLMIRNYLDGVHLKTMGLNGPDGSLYIYTATPEDWRASREFKAASGMVKDYFTLLDSETRAIASRGQRLVHGKPPIFNYSVALNPVPLTAFERRYLWSDEVIITDNITGEVIGFNRRLMRRWYKLQPDFVGNRFYYPHAMCGESGILLEGRVYTYTKKFHNQIQKHVVGINFLLFRNKKGVSNGY